MRDGWQRTARRVARWATCAAILVACGSARPAGTDEGVNGNNLGDAAGGTCAPGRAGCPCTTPGESAACGTIVTRAGGYVTCSMGDSVCTNGTWGTCAGKTLVTKSLQSASLEGGNLHFESVTGPCGSANVCDPNSNCTQVVGTPASDVPLDAGLYVTEAGVTLLPPDANTTGPTCTGLQCQVVACDGGVTTTITGTVTDPAGNNPLYNITVYVPVNATAALPTFTEGASCSTCSGAAPLNAVSVTTTATDGTFTLTNVPSGANIPIVVQSGKWRREILLTNVMPCVANSVSANCTAGVSSPLCTLRLPQSHTDGYDPVAGTYTKADMPEMAMITGAADPLECILVKAGISLTEFSSYDVNPSAKVHFFQSPDAPGAKLDPAYGNQKTGDILWLDSVDPASPTAPHTAPHYDYYDVVLDACEGASIDKEPRYKTQGGGEPYKNLIDYTDIGGRAFVTHFSYVWLEYPWLTGAPLTKYATPYVSGSDNWSGVANWERSNS